MKYMAFYGRTYYPSGGIKDLIGYYNTHEEAVAAILVASAEDTDEKIDEVFNKWWWGHVLDIENEEIVWKHN